MKFPPYPKYKPSDVEWLREIPRQWDVKRGRFAMQVNPPCVRMRELDQNDEVSFVPMEALGIEGGMNLEQARVIADIVGGYTQFQDGDVVVAKITPCFENGKAALATNLTNGAAFGTTELHALRSRASIEQRFLFYVAISDTFRKLGEAEMYGAGGQKRVPAEFIKDFRTPLPPFPEQQAIADTLDREMGRIGRLIAKKRELIERLKEKRTALISHTVTRGLPPAAARAAELFENPPLKPSGVEWIKQIPAHWDLIPLVYLVRFSGGATPDKSNSAYWDGSIPWVSPKDMKVARIADSEDHVSPEALDNSALRLIPIGLVLIVVRGMILAHSFPVAMTTVPVTINQDMKAVACGTRLTADFLSWAFIGFAKTFVSFTDESAHGTRKLETETLKRFPFFLPPIQEQNAISAYLDAETAKLDGLVRKVEEAIERWQEYRIALITAAVTGKIDVRRTAAG